MLRVCYVTNWSRYRAGEAKFEIEFIDPFMCSHIIYAYATVDDHKPEIIPVQKDDLGLKTKFLEKVLTKIIILF
jgi:chitinase